MESPLALLTSSSPWGMYVPCFPSFPSSLPFPPLSRTHLLVPFHVYLYYPRFWFGLGLIFLWETFESILTYVFHGDYVIFVGDVVSNAVESSFDSLVYDVFNGLLGILMAYLLLRLIGKGPGAWSPSTFWAPGDREWGLWPPARALGLASGGGPPAERKRRLAYWKYAVQLKLLALPAAFYAWVLVGGFRIGAALYLASNLVLLAIFYAWNRDATGHGARYDRLYAWWIAIATILGASQLLPVMPVPPAFASWAACGLVLIAECSALATVRRSSPSPHREVHGAGVTSFFESAPVASDERYG